MIFSMVNLVSKTTAIKFLMDKYAIAREEVMAIGDNYNDIEMLQFAGLGIAMGNAPADVKVCADYVTLDNDSEGIQNVLNRFIQYKVWFFQLEFIVIYFLLQEF